MSRIHPKVQEAVNDFGRAYFTHKRVIHWNTVKFTGTDRKHQDMIYEICYWLYEQGIPFATEAEFTTGYRPDIVCPTHIIPIIEVRNTETDKRTTEKFGRIPDELVGEIIYVDADQEFSEELIL